MNSFGHTAKVLKAALRCVSKTGYAYLYDRQDARFVTINQPAFRALEKAVAEYREAKRKRK